MSMVHDDAVFFADDKSFETWLVDNASTATHVWVRMAKKGTGVTSIDWTTAVDVALCLGWIDGIARRLDDEYEAALPLLRLVPARPDLSAVSPPDWPCPAPRAGRTVSGIRPRLEQAPQLYRRPRRGRTAFEV